MSKSVLIRVGASIFVAAFLALVATTSHPLQADTGHGAAIAPRGAETDVALSNEFSPDWTATVPNSDAITNTDTSPGNHITAQWCGSLSSYTTWWYYSDERRWKPILYVWKGRGRGNPYSMSIYFTNSAGTVVPVPNNGSGVQTWSGPQVDPGNGWVGYYISTGWRTVNPLNGSWDDDWRWRVFGCLP